MGHAVIPFNLTAPTVDNTATSDISVCMASAAKIKICPTSQHFSCFKKYNKNAKCIGNNVDRGDDFSFATAYRLYGSRECGAPLKL